MGEPGAKVGTGPVGGEQVKRHPMTMKSLDARARNGLVQQLLGALLHLLLLGRVLLGGEP